MTSPGTLLTRAVDWASHLHAQQRRKVSGAPYVAHLFGAAGIAASVSDDEVVLAAAMLHDAVEDQDATYANAQRALGTNRCDEVWPVVVKCTDVVDRRRYTSWYKRKEAYLMSMDNLDADAEPVFVRRVVTVALADKLYNARSIENELRTEGVAAFDRMAGGTESIFWYLPSLADRLETLALAIGDEPLVALAAEYRETVERIQTIYNVLPRLEDDLRIGRAADLAMGIKNLHVMDRRGRRLRVDIRLTPERNAPLATEYPDFKPSRAADESKIFPNAISSAARWVVERTRDTGGFAAVSEAFVAASIALEHGASTSEACGALLVGLATGDNALDPKQEEFVAWLGEELGRETFDIVKECRDYMVRHHGEPRAGVLQKHLPTLFPRPRLRASVFTVLAAVELPRATALEARLEEQLEQSPVERVVENPSDELRSLEYFAEECRRASKGSLATELADVHARIQVYLEAGRQLTEDRLGAAFEASETIQLTGPKGRPFIFATPDGSRIRAEISVRAELARQMAIAPDPGR